MRVLLLLIALTAVLLGCTAEQQRVGPTPTITGPGPTNTIAGSATPTRTTGAALALFDAHVHYSAEAWPVYPPERAIEILRSSGVTRALVSSTPDQGTWRLYERAPDLVVPFLRPYRTDVGSSAWARDGTTVAYVRSVYRPGMHRGIGEIHLQAGETELPVVRALFEMAVSEKIWLQIHTDARGIDEVMRGPAAKTRVLWAHAGQTASPSEIGALIAKYPTMWVELAGRTDIAAGGTIAPAWRDLLVRYADRFLVGSDTWINPQWERLAEIEAENVAWLAQLPPDVARKIATGNAEVLFPRR